MIINHFQFQCFFFVNFFYSISECFKVFSYIKIITLIQSLNLVYPFFNFDMYSFEIKIAIDGNKAEELVNTIPMLGFINDFVEEVIAEPAPNKISVIINKTLFLFKLLYFFL